MPNLRMAIRSIPNPNAQPLNSSGSMFTALRTFGMHHPATPQLDPLFPGLRTRRRFRPTGLGEREEAGAKPHPGAGSKIRFNELEDRAFQIDHRHVADR